MVCVNYYWSSIFATLTSVIDIVFCRTWFKVNVSQFYNPVVTLLLPSDNKNSWKGVRTSGQIKREKGIRNQPDRDSLYKVNINFYIWKRQKFRIMLTK